MSKKDSIFSIIFFLMGIFSRIPLIEKMQSHWDGPQYSIAIVRYSLEQSTPAPPGYPLYIALGKFFSLFIKDPHLSLLYVSVLFSGLGAALFYITGKNIFNRWVGLISSAIFLSGSSFYFLGITTYAYIIPAVMTTSIGLITYEITFKKKNLGVLLGTTFALALGFRPQEFLFIVSLFLMGFFFLDTKEKIKTSLVFVSIFLLWFIPFLFVVGGLENYIKESKSFAQKGALPPFSFLYLKSSYFKIIQGLYFSFGIGIVFLSYFYVPLYRLIKKGALIRTLKSKKILFFSAWILPSLGFNIFVRTEHPGYQMDYLSALVLLLSFGMWRVTKKNPLLLYITIAAVISVNLIIFFWNRDSEYKLPYRESSFHYWEIHKNDVRLSDQIGFIKKNFDPQSSIIITSPFPWRRLMYYLPNYRIYDIEALFTNENKYKYILRDSKNWNYEEFNNQNLIFAIPSFIQTVVFTDSDVPNWLKDPSERTINLKYNARITWVSVKPGEKYRTEYRLFEKVPS